MSRTWVVVADQSLARIFAAEGATGPLLELESLPHPEGRAHERDLTEDRPGRVIARGGLGLHSMEDDGRRDASTEAFAKEIAERLEAARAEGRLERLVLVAPPAMLGILRQQLSASIQALVTCEIHKELVGFDAAGIRSHLPEKL